MEKSKPPVMSEKPLAISMGDPFGIGPEICIKAAQKGALTSCVIIGDKARLRLAAKVCGLEPEFVDKLDVQQLGPGFPHQAFGQLDAIAGKASFAYVQEAIKGTQENRFAGLVTAPINKAAWAAGGISYPGHTEVLADMAGGVEVAMMLANAEIRTVLVSIHVPLVEACKMVTFERELKTIRKAHSACLALGINQPRVAVCGLNPHAGENGLFGSEDQEIVLPSILAAKDEGINASGPWPGDTIFARARKGEFDIVVAQYHDQGLIPVKYMGIDEGVNATMGLPFVRTSPDHGTAFDIAGTGKADPASLIAAISYAWRLCEAKSP